MITGKTTEAKPATIMCVCITSLIARTTLLEQSPWMGDYTLIKAGLSGTRHVKGIKEIFFPEARKQAHGVYNKVQPRARKGYQRNTFTCVSWFSKWRIGRTGIQNYRSQKSSIYFKRLCGNAKIQEVSIPFRNVHRYRCCETVRFQPILI